MQGWVVTGCYGQLGSALVDQLEREGVPVHASDMDTLDIADPAAVGAYLDALPTPAVLANAAAYTHVDRCEQEPEQAARANREGPAVLARACAARGIRLVHVSTDYVFAGKGKEPYRETDSADPQSTYGRTKLEGEQAVLAAAPDALVVRTSWVFGRGRNFIAAILEQAAARRTGEAQGPLRVVDDQRGCPTYATDLAEGIRALVEAKAQGLYHLSNAGETTWWDLARFCLDESDMADLEVERIRTASLDLPAPRPAWSVLDCRKAGDLGVRLRPWPDAVRAYLASNDSPLRNAGGSA
jgi:dTDP-4-dehydrorhamnose reductase